MHTCFYENIKVCKLDENISLGSCLNTACEISDSKYIAKFDDDDYYSSLYLDEVYNIYENTNCDIVGKYKVFSYIEKYNSLILKNSNI